LTSVNVPFNPVVPHNVPCGLPSSHCDIFSPPSSASESPYWFLLGLRIFESVVVPVPVADGPSRASLDGGSEARVILRQPSPLSDRVGLTIPYPERIPVQTHLAARSANTRIARMPCRVTSLERRRCARGSRRTPWADARGGSGAKVSGRVRRRAPGAGSPPGWGCEPPRAEKRAVPARRTRWRAATVAWGSEASSCAVELVSRPPPGASTVEIPGRGRRARGRRSPMGGVGEARQTRPECRWQSRQARAETWPEAGGHRRAGWGTPGRGELDRPSVGGTAIADIKMVLLVY
jgi:hypothetical protein